MQRSHFPVLIIKFNRGVQINTYLWKKYGSYDF